MDINSGQTRVSGSCWLVIQHTHAEHMGHNMQKQITYFVLDCTAGLYYQLHKLYRLSQKRRVGLMWCFYCQYLKSSVLCFDLWKKMSIGPSVFSHLAYWPKRHPFTTLKTFSLFWFQQKLFVLEGLIIICADNDTGWWFNKHDYLKLSVEPSGRYLKGSHCSLKQNQIV